jgi:hypothetical protein
VGGRKEGRKEGRKAKYQIMQQDSDQGRAGVGGKPIAQLKTVEMLLSPHLEAF